MVHCPEGPVAPSPFIIDPSGAYIRREGTNKHYLCGISPNKVRSLSLFFFGILAAPQYFNLTKKKLPAAILL